MFPKHRRAQLGRRFHLNLSRASIGAASFIATGAFLATTAPNSFATQAAPHVSQSIYVTTTSTSTAYNQGYSQGHADATVYPYENSEVILDFGGMNAANTGTIFITNNGSGATYAQIRAYAEQYALGYYTGASQNRDVKSVLSLAISTNNSAYQVDQAGGATWANSVVDPVQTWVTNQGLGYQVSPEAGNDMEPSYHGPADTIAWVTGYQNAAGTANDFVLNYGSADGCSWTSYNNTNCNNGWTQGDVYKVSWGLTSAYAMPEIYYDPSCSVSGVMARQWTLISRFGHYNRPNGAIIFDGPLTQSNGSGGGGCTSLQAWNAFWAELNTDSSLPLGPDGLSSTKSGFSYRSNI